MLDFDSGGQSLFYRDVFQGGFHPGLTGGCHPNHSQRNFFHVARSKPPKGVVQNQELR
jgi:hypothetical protein